MTFCGIASKEKIARKKASLFVCVSALNTEMNFWRFPNAKDWDDVTKIESQTNMQITSLFKQLFLKIDLWTNKDSKNVMHLPWHGSQSFYNSILDLLMHFLFISQFCENESDCIEGNGKWYPSIKMGIHQTSCFRSRWIG